MADIYNIDVKDSANRNISMSEFTGKTLLIVNVASKCGLTPQYEGLQKLYDDYKDEDFVVLGFPCNQFGGQEPGTDKEIGKFCDINYSVTFPIFSKIKVNGRSIIVDQIKIEPVTFSFSLLLIFKVITPPIT